MRDDDRIRILHMIDAAQAAEQFIRGKKREVLDADRLLLFAVLPAVEVIGEAASKVTDETQAAMPSIPGRLCPLRRHRRPFHREAVPEVGLRFLVHEVHVATLQSASK